MLHLKKIISKFFRIFGFQIQKYSHKSNNVKEPYYHFRKMLSNIKSPVIFDIGAYIGDTVSLFNASFPTSTIHAFEPFDESFDHLENRFSDKKNIMVNNKAIGSSISNNQSMYITKNSGSSSLLQPEKDANILWKGDPLEFKKKINVKTTTIDFYCKNNNIKNIDLLKIDVQGSELDVLKGAEKTLKDEMVKLIFTEISIAPNYKEQTDLDALINYLKKYNFKIFNFFKMKHNNGRLIECDMLFFHD